MSPAPVCAAPVWSGRFPGHTHKMADVTELRPTYGEFQARFLSLSLSRPESESESSAPPEKCVVSPGANARRVDVPAERDRSSSGWTRIPSGRLIDRRPALNIQRSPANRKHRAKRTVTNPKHRPRCACTRLLTH